jgi:hypothetical protein
MHAVPRASDSTRVSELENGKNGQRSEVCGGIAVDDSDARPLFGAARARPPLCPPRPGRLRPLSAAAIRRSAAFAALNRTDMAAQMRRLPLRNREPGAGGIPSGHWRPARSGALPKLSSAAHNREPRFRKRNPSLREGSKPEKVDAIELSNRRVRCGRKTVGIPLI